jgi:hypothetical protein
MAKKPKFKPVITRVKLNPEQAVLTCTCSNGNVPDWLSFSQDFVATNHPGCSPLGGRPQSYRMCSHAGPFHNGTFMQSLPTAVS